MERELKTIIEDELTSLIKKEVRFVTFDQISPSHKTNKVYRTTTNHRKHFIVKHMIKPKIALYTTEAAPDFSFTNEVISTMFLNMIDTGDLFPRIIHFSQKEKFVVLNYIEHQNTLLSILNTKNRDEANKSLFKLVETLASLHIKTQLHSNRLFFGNLCRRFGVEPYYEYLHLSMFIKDHTLMLLTQSESLGVNFSFEAQLEINKALKNIFSDNNLVYSHNDLCPDNILLNRDKCTLIDFELSGFSSLYLDLTTFRFMFPCCGFASQIPSEIVNYLEKKYFDIISEHWLTLKYDDYLNNLTDAYLVRLVISLLDKIRWTGNLTSERQWGLALYSDRIFSWMTTYISLPLAQQRHPYFFSFIEKILFQFKINVTADLKMLPMFPAYE